MGQGFDVQSEALRRYGAAAEDAADRVEAIRRRNAGLTLSQGTFGRLPESDNLTSDYDTQMEESADDLASAAETLLSIADGIRRSAENYDTNEDEQARGFGGGGS
jgi:hypothetical protein